MTPNAALKIPVPGLASVLGATSRKVVDLDIIQLPDPVGHRMIVALPTMEERTVGGIIIPEETNERERAASVIGRVVAMGPECFLDPKPQLPDNLPAGASITVVTPPPRFPLGRRCEVGATILFSRYAGARFTVEGVEFRVLNDDEFLCTIPDGAKVGGL